MKKSLIYLLILLLSAGCTKKSYSQHKKQLKTSQIRISADKPNHSYHSKIDYKLQGMVYDNGNKHWMKSKKQFKHISGSWDELSNGYHWDKRKWENPKHGCRYHDPLFFNRKRMKFKPAPKKATPIAKDQK
jgi:hypothetical protein